MNRVALSAGLFCLALIGCGGGSDAPSPAPSPAPAPAPTPAPAPPPAAATARLGVTVIDSDGRAVPGASLTSSAGAATTGAAGTATLDVATGAERTVRIVKDGFAEQIKVVNIADGATTASLQAMLIAREPAQVLAANEAGGTVSGKHGIRITLPPNAFATANGAAVTGAVQMTLTPVDVTSLDVGAFPGVFEGTAPGSPRAPIASYGSAELVPQQNGQTLVLAAGKSADIELPFYERKHPNGADVRAGDQVPLWSLDTATGVWRQEGQGTVVLSSGSPTGLALRATIAHFSWWNLDAYIDQATVTLQVNVSGATAPPETAASVDARVVAGTGPTTVANTIVTVGQVSTVSVVANSTTQLSASVDIPGLTCNGTVSVSPAPNTTVSATITATCVDVPQPQIVTPGAISATNSTSLVQIRALVDGPPEDGVELYVSDTRIAQFGLQAFYTAYWDSSTFDEGTYQITARAIRQGVVRNSTPVEIVVDRTPPTLVQIAPTIGSEVAQTTVYTVDFSEPVNPLPFALTDVVKLAVTPLAATTPVEVPITASLSTDGQRLTLQANAVLPLGTASVSWGGLRDAAGNAITGTIAATFPIARTQFLFTQEQRYVDHGPPIAITSSGQVIAAWVADDGPAGDVGDTLRVAIRNATGFTPIGAPTDNPLGAPRGLFHYFDFVLDATDRPHVVYTPVSTAGDQLIVRRFANGAWQTLGTPFAGISAAANQQPRLRIDPSGRPVLAFVRPNLVEVHRYDEGSNTWVSLGSPASVLGGIQDAPFAFDFMPNGEPIVASSICCTLQVKAARFNGSGWTQLGGVLATINSNAIDVVGSANGPWLLFFDRSLRAYRLLRFNGTDWDEHVVPTPSNAVTLQPPQALALLNGNPVLLVNDFSLGVFITRFINGTFEPLFPALGRPSKLSLAVRGNAVAAGVQDFGGNLHVYQVQFP